MLRRVRKYIEAEGLLRKGDRVLVCISGGADSVALLDVLLRAGYDCIAAHCNFHLRGGESMRDEQFVRNLCEQLHIRLLVRDFDTLAYAKENKVGIEVAARNLRYDWFDRVAQAEHCQAVAVAHHQNDQAETLLLNLLRGTGIRGLCGMRPIAANPLHPEGVKIIRPLLCTTRDYIEYYLRSKRHLAWVVDSTNADTAIARNAIRAQLAQCSKAEIENIAQTAERMQGYADWLERKDTRKAGIAKLYEQMRQYGFPEIEKMYDALQRGEGGKIFYAPEYAATIKHRQFVITKRPEPLRFGIVGYPLEHSFSARYFADKFRRGHIRGEYRLYPIEPNSFTEETICPLLDTLDGMNVTFPYKEKIIPYLDRLDDTAQSIGAVNVICKRVGYNTDCIGFIEALRPLLLPADRQALVLGTGGAAKAVLYGLKQLGITPTLVSRTPKAGQLTYTQLDKETMLQHTLVINCTPLGMLPDVNTCPAIPYDLLTPAHLLFDCVYNPAETLFLRKGREHGTRTSNGLQMLYGQAEAAWHIWNNL